ncbi:MAG: hypothetical protein ACYC1K_02820 [Minisyncoccota bacterium]
MKTLSALLERFKKSLGKDTVNKDLIISIIENFVGIRLKAEEVNIKEATLEIISSPAKKNEIKLKEEQILFEIRAQTHQNISRIFYK